jgi:hypothetical protein
MVYWSFGPEQDAKNASAIQNNITFFIRIPPFLWSHRGLAPDNVYTTDLDRLIG